MLKKLKNILLLQGVVIIYTISSIMSKNASANRDNFMRFLFFFRNGVCCFGHLCNALAADN